MKAHHENCPWNLKNTVFLTREGWECLWCSAYAAGEAAGRAAQRMSDSEIENVEQAAFYAEAHGESVRIDPDEVRKIVAALRGTPQPTMLGVPITEAERDRCGPRGCRAGEQKHRVGTMTPDNEARARAWVEAALTNEGVLYREAGKPYLSGKGEAIISGCVGALLAAVRAKGEMIANDIEGETCAVRCNCRSCGWLNALAEDIRAHAADVPEVSR